MDKIKEMVRIAYEALEEKRVKTSALLISQGYLRLLIISSLRTATATAR